MLVVSREVGECVQIGEDIRVTVVRIDRGKVRLGVECPRNLLVLRGELVRTPDDEPVRVLIAGGQDDDN